MVNSTLDAMIVRNDNKSYDEFYHRADKTPALYVILGRQVIDDLLAEGYRTMSPIHAKYAEITFEAISEVVPD